MISSSDCEKIVEKSNVLVEQILEENKDNMNYLIIPMSIYNILGMNENFKNASALDTTNGLYFVGNLLYFNVYVDVFMEPNEILFHYDVLTARDMKLESLLNNIDTKVSKRFTVFR